MTWILFVSFALLLVIGVPITFVLILSTVAYAFTTGDVSWMIIPQRITRGVSSFTMICLPFFILAGNIMNRGGITKRLVDCAQVMVGHIRGGLAMVNVMVSMLFGGITGSGVAGTSAVGSLMIPAMKEQGYEPEFAAGLTAVASTCAPIIPPSLTLVIYGAAVKTSIGDLFLAGYLPGILMGLCMMVVVYIYALKRNYPKMPRPSLKEAAVTIWRSLPSLGLPVVIIVGIVGGFFTPTEASAIACLYALILAVIYKSINLKELWKALVDASIDSGAVMLIVGACYLFGWVIASEQITQSLTAGLVALAMPVWAKLIVINLALLVVGMFMDCAPAVMLIAPVLSPAMIAMGIHPIQVGLIICLNLVIGLATPPVGVCLFTASNIGKVSFEKTIKASLPFTAAVLFVLMLVTYVPAVSLTLPRLFGLA
ncbi:MAG: TRAP transporter large permease [Oscillospiraceae bacterium]